MSVAPPTGENSLRIDAPAKINLWLHVIGRRDDGYHELDSVFCRLQWGDELKLTWQPGRQLEVTCSCFGQPASSMAALSSPDNLAARAARALLDTLGQTGRVRIELQKRTWIAAGLGGGSSDAAAVLLGLCRLLGRQPHDLPELAKTLGADVPFFLGAPVARARGIGEVLDPLDGFPALDIVLVNPGRPLPTPAVFARLGLKPGQRFRQPDAAAFAPPYALSTLVERMANDLEPAARQICPEIGRLQLLLRDYGALAACLSGSGPTVFGVFQSAAIASSAARDIARNHGLLTVATQTRAGLTPRG